jgi:hypothetical protein
MAIFQDSRDVISEIVGYAEPWIVSPGDEVMFKVSLHRTVSAIIMLAGL